MLYKTLLKSCLAVAVVLASLNAQAAEEETGLRKIVAVGCHNGDGTCFVSLDGPAFGTSLGCPVTSTNEFRFDNGNTDSGKRTYSTLLAAYLSGKNVSIHLSGCSAQGWPTLMWFHISN